MKRRLIVGITSASGSMYGVQLLRLLREVPDVESHLIVSQAAALTLKHETDLTLSDVKSLADVVHHHGDVGASIASGSFVTDGMIVAPCSIRTLSGISTCASDTLMTRAADVCLKERRKLLLLVRETPLHLGHLRAMVAATEMGAVIMPPVPALYARPQSVDDVIDYTVSRALDFFGIAVPGMKRWGEDWSL